MASLIMMGLLLILALPTQAKKNKKDRASKETTQADQTQAQAMPFELDLSIVRGERSRDSYREYIFVNIDDRQVVYHSEYDGRPRKDVPERFDTNFTLTDDQYHGLMAYLSKLGLLKELSEKKDVTGAGSYVRIQLKIRHHNQTFESNITGLTRDFTNKENEISEAAKSLQEGVLKFVSFLKKLSPNKPESKISNS